MSLLVRLFNIARSNLGRVRPDSETISDFGVGDDGSDAGVPVNRDSPAERYYANLELAPGASFEDIRAAYRRLLRKYHPDKHDRDPEKSRIAEEISKRLNEAMEYFEKEHDGGRL